MIEVHRPSALIRNESKPFGFLTYRLFMSITSISRKPDISLETIHTVMAMKQSFEEGKE